MVAELLALVARWRLEAELYRRRGRTSDADSLESLVAELEAVLVNFYAATASRHVAAELIGYSLVHVDRLLKTGVVRQKEGPEGLEVYLCDLPVHAGRLPYLLGSHALNRPTDAPIELQQAQIRQRRDLIKKLG
jgi:hypothetical protein